MRAARVLACASLFVAFGRAGLADDAQAVAGPAPRLDMRDFPDRGHYRSGNGSVSFSLDFPTKIAGDVLWYGTDAYVMPDNAYTRWAEAALRDVTLRRRAAWDPDPKIFTCCARLGHTDERGAATIDGLSPGSYVLFTGVTTHTNAWTPTFASHDGFDADGDRATAMIPTIAFADRSIEALFVEVHFTIGSLATTAPTVVVPRIVDDVVFSS